MNKFISIIIVNYNGKKWLKKVLDSLSCQTYKNFEIIFVDNKSIDESVEFVAENYPKVNIIKSEKNLGFSGGNNLGIKVAKGEYILLLNNDTWLDNNFLEKIVTFYEKSNYDIVCAVEADYYTKECQVYTNLLDPFGHYVYIKGGDGSREFYLSASCLFFNKNIYYETRGLDENFFMYAEDWDWFWRIQLLGKKIFKINDLKFYHLGAGSTGTGIKYHSFLWRNQNALQMLLKNYRWYNLLWVLPIYFAQNIVEIIFFLITFKPKIAYSYIEGWAFNIKNFKKIMDKRKWVQENRKVGDWGIIKKMYVGFAKFRHLVNFYK